VFVRSLPGLRIVRVLRTADLACKMKRGNGHGSDVAGGFDKTVEQELASGELSSRDELIRTGGSDTSSTSVSAASIGSMRSAESARRLIKRACTRSG